MSVQLELDFNSDKPREQDIARWAGHRGALRDYLADGHSITQDEARDRFGVMRLSARISEMKKAGMKIIRTWEQLGEARVARYSLAE